MRTTIVSATALAGGLLLVPLMLGPIQAGVAPDLKNALSENALSAAHNNAITLVRGGGGGGRGAGHGGGFAMGGGHMRGGGLGGH